jgi:hypothetical protein
VDRSRGKVGDGLRGEEVARGRPDRVGEAADCSQTAGIERGMATAGGVALREKEEARGGWGRCFWRRVGRAPLAFLGTGGVGVTALVSSV